MKFKLHLPFSYFIIGLLLVITFLYNDVTTNASTNYIVDSANLLTESEHKLLLQDIKTFNKEHSTSLYIYTVNSINDQSISQYSQELYHEIGEKNLILLLVNMSTDSPNNRAIQIDVFDENSSTITDERCDSLYTLIKDDFSNGYYYEGMLSFINKCDYYLEHSPKVDSLFYQCWFQLLLSLVIGGIVVSIMTYNSGGRQTTTQSTYLNKSTSKLLNSYDHYLRTQVTRTKRPTQNDSNGDSGGGNSSGGFHSSGGGGF